MLSLHDTTLLAHSTVRWGVLGAAVLCVARFAIGWARSRPFDRSDERALRLFLAIVDTQLVLGLMLYGVLSPLGAAALGAPGVLQNVVLRFFALEHPLIMLVGVTVLHGGVIRAKRLGTDPQRHRTVLRAIALALALFLFGVPWPGLPYARPLFRGLP